MNTRKIISNGVIAVIGGLVAVFAYSLLTKNYGTQVVYKDTAPVKFANMMPGATGTFTDFTEAAQKSVHAVVHVKTLYQQQERYYGNPLYDFFFGQGGYVQTPQPIVGSGSGVIISDDGYIVTNNHVIEHSDNIEVVLNDKRSYTARLIGTDPTTDIALLKIDDKNLPYASYGNSDDLKVGEWVLAVGNPFNLTSTVTAGIVSAKARNINILAKNFAIESFIQTDAAVNPGNSGGALVNTKGELVGINTAIASNTGSFTGYSFAIPVNIVKKIVADMVEFGEVQRAYIGVNIANIDAKLAEEKGLEKIEGVYVESTNEGGAAAEAGMQSGDIILKIGELAVNNVPELQEQISKYRPGDKINVTVKRGTSLKDLLVTLKNVHGDTRIVKTETAVVMGAKLQEASNEEKAKFRMKGGVKVIELGSGKLRAAGVKEGFIITNINKKPVYSVEDIKTFLENIQGGVFIEGVYPNGMSAYYAFGM